MRVAERNIESRDEVQGLSLVDFAHLWQKYKKLVAVVTIVGFLVGVAAALLMPAIYRAKTTMLSPEQSPSAATQMLGQLGTLAGLSGKDLGLKDRGAQVVGMLKSRTVADRLIERFKLQDVYRTKLESDTRTALAEATTITMGKNDGIISIEIEDKNAKRAAELANAYPEELARLAQEVSVSESSQRRIFFEKQVAQTKEQLAEAEAQLKATQEKTGIIQPEGQARATIEYLAALNGEIAAKQVQISAMRSFATEKNPDLLQAESELSALKVELSKMVSKGNKSSLQVSTQEAPAAGLEYLRRFRDVKYYETIYELLSKQYEAAKIDEAREAIAVQVLDKAVEPDKRSKPVRTVVVLLATTSGFMIALAIIAIKEFGWNLRYRRTITS